MRHDLTITISGGAGSGRTTMAMEIERRLNELGFKVSFAETDRPDSERQDDRLAAIAARGSVLTIKTVQTAREATERSNAR